MTDESDVRDVFTQWIEAIQTKNIAGVLANHDPDIVMFDVPAPYHGLRGIDEYRDSWPSFFDFLDQGAQFELVELDVVAGSDVAFAYALLWCGTEAQRDADPENRLRVTTGLRKVDGQWVVVHEHASFPMTNTPP
jgi:ketosteroid isomerase-like protein